MTTTEETILEQAVAAFQQATGIPMDITALNAQGEQANTDVIVRLQENILFTVEAKKTSSTTLVPPSSKSGNSIIQNKHFWSPSTFPLKKPSNSNKLMFSLLIQPEMPLSIGHQNLSTSVVISLKKPPHL